MTVAEFEEYSPLVRSMCDQFCKRFSACNYIDRNEMESECWECFLNVKKTYTGDERAFRFYLVVALKNTIYNVLNRQKRHSVLVSFDAEIMPEFFVADIVAENPDKRRSDAKMFLAVRRAWCSLTDDQRSRARVLLEPQKYGAVSRYAKARGESAANFSMKLSKIKRILRSRIMFEMISQRKAEK